MMIMKVCVPGVSGIIGASEVRSGGGEEQDSGSGPDQISS